VNHHLRVIVVGAAVVVAQVTSSAAAKPTGDGNARRGCQAVASLASKTQQGTAGLQAKQRVELMDAAHALKRSKTRGAAHQADLLATALTRSRSAQRSSVKQVRTWCRSSQAALGTLGAIGGIGAKPFGGPNCPAPDVGGWAHGDFAHATVFAPDAHWNVVDAANSTTVSSPLGDAKTGISFAADPSNYFQGPTQVASFYFQAGAVTNVQILDQDQPYAASGGGMQQDFEFTAVNQGELAQAGTPVHGWATAYYLSAGASSYYLTWLELANNDVAGDYCGTLFEIRTLLRRL
jgi:hypothetical protein